MDHWIISAIFLGMFGIYLVPYDSYPLAEAEAEAEVTSPDIKRTSLSLFVLLASCLDTENAKLTHFKLKRLGRLS